VSIEKWKASAEAPNFAQILNFEYLLIISKETRRSVLGGGSYSGFRQSPNYGG